MPTKFGRFVSGKPFLTIFLLIYALFMCFAAKETNAALCYLMSRTHMFGFVHLLFTLTLIPLVYKRMKVPHWFRRSYKKMMGFLRCFMINYSMILPLWEIICLVFDIPYKTQAIGVIASIGICMMIVLIGYLNSKIIRTKRYTISMNQGRDECRIALISDLHLGFFVGERHVQKMVSQINALNPDVVVISGDIFDVDNAMLDRPEELGRISRQLRRIKAKEGVYAVVGNHDPEIANPVFARFLKDSGIVLLDNDVKVLAGINLVGRTDGDCGQRIPLAEMLRRADQFKSLVVLDHRPENIPESVEQGAALVLCGHTHRGQIFPITLFTKWANGRDSFYGHIRKENTHCVITSGVGFFELPMRLGTSNEIVDIRLKNIRLDTTSSGAPYEKACC